MQGAQAVLLPDGRRLHLNHGPIDLIVEAWGPGRDAAYRRATERFETVLQELVDELPELRRPASEDVDFTGSVARRMREAVAPYPDIFITPMAAVAGGVADEILASMADGGAIEKAYVNNGGDAAFLLRPGQKIEAAIAAPIAGQISVRAEDPFRGIATSGWRGRSQSLGIADAVSVVAINAATADAAATLIANAVDLPGHPAIHRRPARELFADSDLGERMVTADVGPISDKETSEALDRGVSFARCLLESRIIAGASLILDNDARCVGAIEI
jgi:hypothetical protein